MTKKILLFAFLTMFVSIKTISAQTTLQDYNYVCKGLLDDLNNGKEVKTGYKIESTTISGQINQGDGFLRNAEIYYFKKKSNDKTQAFAIECTDNAGNRRFLCIPVSGTGSAIWTIAFKEFNGTGNEWHTVFMWAFAKLIANKLS